jgi:hypothetical protein
MAAADGHEELEAEITLGTMLLACLPTSSQRQ